MIEKKKDVRKIQQLRIIGILEADFNTALKILFAKKLMAQLETNFLHKDQWGSRLNRTSTDPALQKRTNFEYGRYTKATIAVFLSDQTACFNQIYSAVTDIIIQDHGMDPAPCLCHNKTLNESQRHIRTALGVLSVLYKTLPHIRSLAWSKATKAWLASGPFQAPLFPLPTVTFTRALIYQE